MKRKAKVKPLVEGKELPPKKAYGPDSSRRQSGDPGGGAGPLALLLTWPRTCLTYPVSRTNHGSEGCSRPPRWVGQSKATIWGRWPGLMNNEYPRASPLAG